MLTEPAVVEKKRGFQPIEAAIVLASSPIVGGLWAAAGAAYEGMRLAIPRDYGVASFKSPLKA